MGSNPYLFVYTQSSNHGAKRMYFNKILNFASVRTFFGSNFFWFECCDTNNYYTKDMNDFIHFKISKLSSFSTQT